MRLSDSNLRLDKAVNPFAVEYVGEILGAVAMAWARMRQPKRSEIEDRITFRLAGRLLNDPLFAALPFDIVPQYSMPSLHGRLLGRLDLRFKHRHSQRDYFAFEAKRLHVTSAGDSFTTEYATYTGEEGMMAFVTGYYSKGLPAAGMLGYVMDGETDTAWTGVGKRIEKCRIPLRLVTESRFSESPLVGAVAKGMEGTRLGETMHDLGTHMLQLFHMLLPVTLGKCAGDVQEKSPRPRGK